ncbi:MAG: Mur ligase domain-containing protein [Rickettsiales bacterium]|jgi:UDP-N-acetylmuramyl pentapeptide synthase|nr:Mur ligase domain-containing protein [Rickettsiales bacterium]
MNIAEILKNSSGRISTDSRAIGVGDIFIALPGDKFDGHNFVSDVLNRGASVAIVQNLVDTAPVEKQIVVPDAFTAYLKFGEYFRNQFHGKIIALTGSAGKTTTKEELKQIIGAQKKVYATMGNFNNRIGVAKTLIEMDMNADVAIIEIGMNHASEIAEIVKYVRPDIAIVTNIYPMHIEFFIDGLNGIANAKSEIFNTGAIAVINRDANLSDVLINNARSCECKIELFGKDNENFPDMPEHFQYNAGCVMKIAELLNMDLDAARESVLGFDALPGRGKKHKIKLGDNAEFILIDDSYSGQPESMKIAIKNLAKIQGRKIAIIGKMAELGDYSVIAHTEIGKLLADKDIDIVIGVGDETRDTLAQLKQSQKQFYFDNSVDVLKFLQNDFICDGDVMLVKGSHYASAVYKIVDVFISDK